MKISIQWYNSQGMGFWLRGIKPDGSFYGELIYAYADPERRVGTTVEGRIPADDWSTCQDLVRQSSSPDRPAKQKWVGQLATWSESISSTDNLFQNETGDEENSTTAKALLELKATVEKHLSEQSKAFVEFIKKSHNRAMEGT